MNITDEDREGRPSDARNTDTIAGVHVLLEDNCRLTVRQLKLLMRDEMMNEVSRSTIWDIIHDDLNLRKVTVWWVPRSLTAKLKGQRMEAMINFLQRYSIEDEDFLNHIITKTFIDESFPKISTKFFRKFSQKFSQDFHKTLLENCSNFSYSSTKISRKFSHFSRVSTNFH